MIIRLLKVRFLQKKKKKEKEKKKERNSKKVNIQWLQ